MCTAVGKLVLLFPRWKNGGDWAGNGDKRGNAGTEREKCMVRF